METPDSGEGVDRWGYMVLQREVLDEIENADDDFQGDPRDPPAFDGPLKVWS